MLVDNIPETEIIKLLTKYLSVFRDMTDELSEKHENGNMKADVETDLFILLKILMIFAADEA